jgi:hypothetical protein
MRTGHVIKGTGKEYGREGDKGTKLYVTDSKGF